VAHRLNDARLKMGIARDLDVQPALLQIEPAQYYG
jgi:hypothetical protein